MSLLEHLQQISDPRSRHRREYPLYALLALVILAAMHGENSLRGMWLWGKERAAVLLRHPALGLCGKGKFPALGTFWYTLQKLRTGELERALSGWLPAEAVYALDGKHLRGSKRGAHAALQVLVLAGQQLRLVLRQEAVMEGDELEAALRLLETVDLEGKIISADAGILKAPLARAVVQKGAVTSA